MLRDVLLGRPEYFRGVGAGAVTRRVWANAAQLGVAFDLLTAMLQQVERVRGAGAWV